MTTMSRPQRISPVHRLACALALSILAALTSLAAAGCSSSPDAPQAGEFEDFLGHATHLGSSLYRINATTEGSSDRATGSCVEPGAPERIYSFTAPADGIARFAQSGTAPALHVRERWDDPATERACNADVNPLTGKADVFVEVHAGQTLYVFADNQDAESSGPFVLDYELLPLFPDLAPLKGVYRSRGYGLVLAIEGDAVHLFEASAHHCLVSLEGPTASLASVVDHIAPGPSPGTLALDINGSFTTIVFERVDALPEPCRNGGTPRIGSPGYRDDALGLFDVFAQTFRDHYTFFDLRGVDWEASVASERAKLTSTSTDAELFASFSSLLAPLHDGHASVHTLEDDFESKPQEIQSVFESEHGALNLPGDVATYVHDQLVLARAAADNAIVGPVGRYQKHLVYGRLPGNVGYLRIHHFMWFRSELGLFLDALDTALASLSDTSRLVLDVRWNGGGSDVAAVEVARRFALDSRVFATKRARDGAGWTATRELMVAPSASPYAGKVALLVSGSTASAGEVFTLALRGRPNVQVIGWPTDGAFSDVLERQLPNGWQFGLSNEEYRAADGRVYEAIGVPPDLLLQGDAYPRVDRIDGVDRVLANVLAVMAK
ncbi:hypothetical protein AKJ09_05831 [Labilithrix luteola]|uniref:Tail specific protease domain-containing protein n=2 Tax=Labilithrix luteola TaxID=1391654 RepID=A0A0K1Q096_9BACT|nr:hypothetical protein AKJ09_05831 [Labilithrix luteola]